MKLACPVSRRPASECPHCGFDSGEGQWGKSVARMIDEWQTDRRDLWRRALEARQKRGPGRPRLRLVVAIPDVVELIASDPEAIGRNAVRLAGKREQR